MTTLAIDTSTQNGSMALHLSKKDNTTSFFTREFEARQNTNSKIFKPLKELIEIAEKNIDYLLVGTGPGSYTGIRVSISAMIGLSIALEAKLIGISSLLAIETPTNSQHFFVGDARLGKYYIKNIENIKTNNNFNLIDKDSFTDQISKFSKNQKLYTFDNKLHNDFRDYNIKLSKPEAKVLITNFFKFYNKSQINIISKNIPQPIYLTNYSH